MPRVKESVPPPSHFTSRVSPLIVAMPWVRSVFPSAHFRVSMVMPALSATVPEHTCGESRATPLSAMAMVTVLPPLVAVQLPLRSLLLAGVPPPSGARRGRCSTGRGLGGRRRSSCSLLPQPVSTSATESPAAANPAVRMCLCTAFLPPVNGVRDRGKLPAGPGRSASTSPDRPALSGPTSSALCAWSRGVGDGRFRVPGQGRSRGRFEPSGPGMRLPVGYGEAIPVARAAAVTARAPPVHVHPPMQAHMNTAMIRGS